VKTSSTRHVCGDLLIRLNDPAHVPSLLEFLRSGSFGCLVEQVGDREIEAALLGSYASEIHNLTLDLLVRAWQATHPDAIIELPPNQ
jgi:hypothetical protein